MIKLLPRLEALPGVESVGAINGLPVSFQGGGATFQIEGRADPDNLTPMTNYRIVTPDYFRTMKIQLVAGRVLPRRIETELSPSRSLANRSRAFRGRMKIRSASVCDGGLQTGRR